MGGVDLSPAQSACQSFVIWDRHCPTSDVVVWNSFQVHAINILLALIIHARREPPPLISPIRRAPRPVWIIIFLALAAFQFQRIAGIFSLLPSERQAGRNEREGATREEREREEATKQKKKRQSERQIGRSGGWQSHNKSKSAEGKTFVFVPSRKRMRRLFAKVQIFNGCCCCSVWVRFMERIIGPNGSWHPNALRLINNCNFHGCLSNSLYVIWGAKCWAFPGEVGKVC